MRREAVGLLVLLYGVAALASALVDQALTVFERAAVALVDAHGRHLAGDRRDRGGRPVAADAPIEADHTAWTR